VIGNVLRAAALSTVALGANVQISHAFSVASGMVVPRASSIPMLTVQPSSVEAGGVITVSGSGLGPAGSAIFYLDQNQLSRFNLSAPGSFSANVTIPIDTTPGEHSATVSTPAASATTSFTVTAIQSTARGVPAPTATGPATKLAPGVAPTPGPPIAHPTAPAPPTPLPVTATSDPIPSPTPLQPTATPTPSPVPPTATVQPTSTPQPTATPTSAAADVVVTVNHNVPAGTSSLAVGTTLTQYSLDSWGDPAAVANGESLLRSGVSFENQHIYGWGANNPEPSPGVYDWSSLDARIQIMWATGVTPIITLCCAPDWMTVPQSSESQYYGVSWQRFTDAPTTDHIAAFAELARQVALRYSSPSNPRPVLYYDVWNEFKGMWSDSNNNWDINGYLALYNAVYDALKSVNPNIQVGGPYLPIEGSGTDPSQWWGVAPISKRNLQTLQAFLAGAHGVDFISFDRAVFDGHDPNTYTVQQAMTWSKNFEDIARQLRSLTNVPIMCTETYFWGDDSNPQEVAAGYASVLYHLLMGGASIALQWGPQGVAPTNGGPASGSLDGSLFTDTRVAGGGQPFPDYAVWKDFNEYFAPGTQLYSASSSASDLLVLASAAHTLLINQENVTRTVSVNGTIVTLAPYQVTVL